MKLSDRKGPIFFKQVRVGLYGELINVLKFRSMRVSEASDTEWMGDAEARVTRVGALLRRSSLDEIPQLINVVRGDMSLVGPAQSGRASSRSSVHPSPATTTVIACGLASPAWPRSSACEATPRSSSG